MCQHLSTFRYESRAENMVFFRLIVVILFLFALFPAQAFSKSGHQILEEVFQANFFESFRAEVALRSEDSQGKSFKLDLTMLGSGNLRTDFSLLLIFREPLSSRGIKLLMLAQKSYPSRVYLYMPAYDRYLQLMGQDRDMKLGDSEISLNDLISSLPWEGTHKFLGERAFSGKPCNVVETTYGGKKGKRISFIEKKTLLPLYTRQLDTEDNLLKTIEVKDFKKIGSKYKVTSMIVTNHQKNRSTVMKIKSSQWYIDIPRGVFQPDNLKFPLKELIEREGSGL